MKILRFISFVSYYATLFLPISMILEQEDFQTKVSCAEFSNKTDMLALLAFKYRITDDPSQVLSSWNQSLHFCQWEGVTCSRRHPRVTALSLTSLKLSGSVSPSIGNLSFLRVIDLSGNRFTGEVPQEVGRLFRLEELLLFNNSFEGHIPANLSGCTQLRVINLNRNNFTGHLPLELGSLRKLLRLYADKNNLTRTIPPSLGNLSTLEELSLSSNQLVGSIPESLSQLKSLTALGFGINMLSGFVPPSIYNLSYLTTLYLAGNQFEGSLPRDLGTKHALPNLKNLILWKNQFSGTIPVSLSNASNLEDLELSVNEFRGGVPIDFGNLKNLYWLGLSFYILGNGDIDDLNFITSLTNCTDLRLMQLGGNNFGGVLPSSIANLSRTLESFLVQQNQISGNIPQGIENLVGLQAIAMQFNQLTGAIPETIGNLYNLVQAGFDKNKFSGRIPPSIGNLTRLSQLYMEDNSLEGSIPPTLGNCHNLQLLNLHGNELTGNIPREVMDLPSLSIAFNLSRNHLSGPIPSEVGNLKNLAKLDVSKNNLSGEIPASVGACTSLVSLDMSDNSFNGVIPDSLGSLRGIEELDLSLNNLTGRLPKSLARLSLLQKLNLSFNNFEGEVPLTGVFSNTSAISLFGNKKLCGGIPALGMPKCSANESRKHIMPLFLKVIISVICGFLVLALVLTLLWIHWKKKVIKQPSPGFSLLDPLMNLSYGDIFKATDGFSSLNLIGMGSFGSVYKGVLELHEQIVAVKVLKLQNKGAAKSFVAECEALRNIRHRNLVKVITACSSIDYQGNDFKALVYEFMPKGSLETWLHPLSQPNDMERERGESRSLSFSQRLDIVTDVAAALDYLHNHCETPIIHRDLKPSNILLDNDMTAHVSDFGLAKIISQRDDVQPSSQSSSSYFKGTIGYAPPEYGIECAATTQGDVYSFGILILEMFTGKRPTDDVLMDDFNLHKMVKMSLPGGVLELADSDLNLERERKRAIVHKCLTAIFGMGVACSEESPRDRPSISSIANELRGIKDLLLKERDARQP